MKNIGRQAKIVLRGNFFALKFTDNLDGELSIHFRIKTVQQDNAVYPEIQSLVVLSSRVTRLASRAIAIAAIIESGVFACTAQRKIYSYLFYPRTKRDYYNVMVKTSNNRFVYKICHSYGLSTGIDSGSSCGSIFTDGAVVK